MGKLIVIEGIDGSGKSTQFELLCNRFASEGKEFRRITFPRYNEESSVFVRMYLNGQFGEGPDSVNAYAASTFFAVDRFASFLQDWRAYYENGGVILTDRYTTSNAIHQGAKLPCEQREFFFKWLYDYEFCLLGLPEPDLVFFMDIDPVQALQRLRRRQAETETFGDIHENDPAYLEKCALCGDQAAALHGWRRIKCVEEECERSEAAINLEIYNQIMCERLWDL